jgi:hypothetical protein
MLSALAAKAPSVRAPASANPWRIMVVSSAFLFRVFRGDGA